VVDIDGVVADVRHRLHHLEGGTRDWEAFFAAMTLDPVLAQGQALVAEARAEGHRVVYLTGRPERWRTDTVTWLAAHGLEGDDLYMRPDTDRRAARVFKVEVLRHLASSAEIIALVDDDPDVVAAVGATGIETRLAEWMPRTAPLRDAQETLGRT
jgi:hypothetical protein